ncbi:hypothetical protein JCM1393_07390 [Clostridium carnis]
MNIKNQLKQKENKKTIDFSENIDYYINMDKQKIKEKLTNINIYKS